MAILETGKTIDYTSKLEKAIPGKWLFIILALL